MVKLGNIKSRNFLLKVVELLLAVLSLALGKGEWVSTTRRKATVVYGTLLGSVVLGVVGVAGEVRGSPLDRALQRIVAGSLALLSLTAGAIMVEAWYKLPYSVPDRVLGAGVMALANGAIFVVDLLTLTAGCVRTKRSASHHDLHIL
ncbi:uncharacterized protein [Periplaneta americana]|uniref:uncharacterized protein isoform X1 n=1 Tax=Periplaneta americana TaxID=6978 RepID=UPI0037E85D1F